MFAALLKATALASLSLTSMQAAPVLAQQSNGTIVVEGQRDKNSKKICKTSEPPTGTRLGSRRICRTAFEWQMEQERSQRMIDRQHVRSQAVAAYNENAKNGLARQ